MRAGRLIVSLASFAAGAAVMTTVRLAGGRIGDAVQTSAHDDPASSSTAAAPRTQGGPDTIPSSGSSVSLTMKDVESADTLDRLACLAKFLRSAKAGDIDVKKIGELDWGGWLGSAMQLTMLRLMELDAAAALPPPHDRRPEKWWAWAQLDSTAAIARAAASSTDELATVIRAIAETDHARAMELVSTYPAADTAETWGPILKTMSREDPAAAAAVASERHFPLDDVMRSWVDKDPRQALAWARGLTDPLQRRRAMSATLKALAASDPSAALKEGLDLPTGRVRAESIASAVAALAQTDPSAARTAAEALTLPVERRLALSEVAAAVVTENPAAALAIMKEVPWEPPSDRLLHTSGSDPDPSSILNAGGRAISQLMKSIPEEAMAVLAALPADHHVPLDHAIKEWALHQPEAANRWLVAQPPGPSRELAIEGFINWMLQTGPKPDYPAAMKWVDALTSAERQRTAAISVGMAWRRSDPAAVRAAAEDPSLSENLRSQLKMISR